MKTKDKIKVCIAIFSAITFIALLILFCMDVHHYIEYKKSIDTFINTKQDLLSPMKRELATSFFIMIIPLMLSLFSIVSIHTTTTNIIANKDYRQNHGKDPHPSTNYNLAEENITFYEKQIQQIQEKRNNENAKFIEHQLAFLNKQLNHWKSIYQNSNKNNEQK